jgi:hypothetical protein
MFSSLFAAHLADSNFGGRITWEKQMPKLKEKNYSFPIYISGVID